ncbi:uncharacterized protein CEXT_174551, partial [Caerostris extrusa]
NLSQSEMPQQRTQKEHKSSRRPGSRWHSFHFSGKVILCSVIFGFLLILIGGILLAIGLDRDEETKSDDYDDLQKKPPLVFVGPVIMGIGGFTVIVGILMCLIETKVFRKRTGDANPLINSERDESAANNSENIGSNPAAMPSTSGHRDKHRHGNRKKSPSPRINRKKGSKSPSPKLDLSSSSQSSAPMSVNSSKNYLSASDTFLTPPSSLSQEHLPMQGNSRDAENQTSSSLLKSFTSSGKSWTTSNEFQTPSASFIDDRPFFQRSPDSDEMTTPLPFSNALGLSAIEKAKREFLTPKNSTDVLESSSEEEVAPEENKQIIREETKQISPEENKHEFLTPKNSDAEILDPSSSDLKRLEARMKSSGSNLPHTTVEKGLSDKTGAENIVNEKPHDLLKQELPKMDNILEDNKSSPSGHPEDVEHSDVQVDVLLDAIEDEVKGNTDSHKNNSEVVNEPHHDIEIDNTAVDSCETEQKSDEPPSPQISENIPYADDISDDICNQEEQNDLDLNIDDADS